MGIFDNPFSDGEAKMGETDESDSSESDDTEETVEVEKTKEKEYTEHTGVATFVDGTEREFTFDDMAERDNSIVLKDYKGFRATPMYGIGGFYGKTFVTIPYAQLKTFETVDRRTETMEYTVTKEFLESEVEA